MTACVAEAPRLGGEAAPQATGIAVNAGASGLAAGIAVDTAWVRVASRNHRIWNCPMASYSAGVIPSRLLCMSIRL